MVVKGLGLGKVVGGEGPRVRVLQVVKWFVVKGLGLGNVVRACGEGVRP